MITYKSYEDIQPMVVTMDKIREFEVGDLINGTLAWVYIDGEPAFQAVSYTHLTLPTTERV